MDKEFKTAIFTKWCNINRESVKKMKLQQTAIAFEAKYFDKVPMFSGKLIR